MEERERNSEVTVQTMDKELTLKQEAIEKHKNKALDCIQTIQEWKLKVDDLESRVNDAESALKSKVEECEKETISTKRCVLWEDDGPKERAVLCLTAGVRKRLVV